MQMGPARSTCKEHQINKKKEETEDHYCATFLLGHANPRRAAGAGERQSCMPLQSKSQSKCVLTQRGMPAAEAWSRSS